MSNNTYNTIEQDGFAEYKERASRFLGYVFPVKNVEECKDRLKAVKKEHAKANHHCYAYRLGTDGLQFRSSDAGEPSGTAGKPILGQIDRLKLTDVLVVVTRYFGGTLLGIPRLTDAYKTTAALSLQMAPLIIKNIERTYRLSFDYTLMHRVMHIVRQYNCTVYDQQMHLFCLMDIGISLQYHDACVSDIREIPQLELIAQ